MKILKIGAKILKAVLKGIFCIESLHALYIYFGNVCCNLKIDSKKQGYISAWSYFNDITNEEAFEKGTENRRREFGRATSGWKWLFGIE